MQSVFEHLLKEYSESVFQKDIKRFKMIYNEQLRVFDLWGIWSMKSQAAWVQSAQGWFDSLASENILVEFSDLEESISDRLGFIHGFVKYQACTIDGKPLRTMMNRFTWCLEKNNNEWQITHEHTSLPLDFETLKPISYKS